MSQVATVGYPWRTLEIKNGHVYIYITNASAVPVWFDNFEVKHKRGQLIEENHYYPYGLKIAALSSRAVAGSVATDIQKHGFQGAFAEDVEDFDLGYQEFALRNYDPQIGRFMNVDPFNQYSSPYLGMGNDPANGVDPTGGFFGSLGTEICEEVCAVANTTLGTAINFAGSLGLSTLGTLSSISFANTAISGNPQQGNPHYTHFLDKNGRTLQVKKMPGQAYDEYIQFKDDNFTLYPDGSVSGGVNTKRWVDWGKPVRGGGRPSASRQRSFKQQARASQTAAKKVSKPPQIEHAEKAQELTLVQRVTEIKVEKQEHGETHEAETEPNEENASVYEAATAVTVAVAATDVLVEYVEGAEDGLISKMGYTVASKIAGGADIGINYLKYKNHEISGVHLAVATFVDLLGIFSFCPAAPVVFGVLDYLLEANGIKW